MSSPGTAGRAWQSRQKLKRAAGSPQDTRAVWERGIETTHVPPIWKGHTVDTSPHVRGPASVRLSLALRWPCVHHAACAQMKTQQTKCFKASVHIWSQAAGSRWRRWNQLCGACDEWTFPLLCFRPLIEFKVILVVYHKWIYSCFW